MARTHLPYSSLPTRANLGAGVDEGNFPRTDVTQTGDALLFILEVPGVEHDDLRLRFEPGTLTIEGRRERPRLAEPSRLLQMEIAYGTFSRSFQLPREADGASIEASYEHGLLQVRVPLRAPVAAPARKVKVS